MGGGGGKGEWPSDRRERKYLSRRAKREYQRRRQGFRGTGILAVLERFSAVLRRPRNPCLRRWYSRFARRDRYFSSKARVSTPPSENSCVVEQSESIDAAERSENSCLVEQREIINAANTIPAAPFNDSLGESLCAALIISWRSRDVLPARAFRQLFPHVCRGSHRRCFAALHREEWKG
jgi:hypothetical protein